MKIEFTYFKPSGKYYSSGEAVFDAALFDGLFTPREIGKKVLCLKQLPGLAGGNWSGPFLVNPENQYPEIVLQ